MNQSLFSDTFVFFDTFIKSDTFKSDTFVKSDTFNKKRSDRFGVLRNQNLLTNDEKARFESVTFSEYVISK